MWVQNMQLAAGQIMHVIFVKFLLNTLTCRDRENQAFYSLLLTSTSTAYSMKPVSIGNAGLFRGFSFSVPQPEPACFRRDLECIL